MKSSIYSVQKSPKSFLTLFFTFFYNMLIKKSITACKYKTRLTEIVYLRNTENKKIQFINKFIYNKKYT